MKLYNQNKATLTLLGAIFGLLLIIIIPTIIITNRNDTKKNFPDYSNVTISESDVADTSSKSYSDIKYKLEHDHNFAKESLISNYNYKTYSSSNLSSLIWNFIFSFELNNSKYISSKGDTKFCLRQSNLVTGFEELYGINITKDLPMFEGYYQYVNINSNRYCFNYKNVSKDYNNDIKLGIDGISVKGDIITTNLYLYEYYTMLTAQEKVMISNLESCINSSDFDGAKSIVINNLNGKVTHKQLQFKINNKGKMFKYQILNSKNIDY